MNDSFVEATIVSFIKQTNTTIANININAAEVAKHMPKLKFTKQ